MTVLFKLSLSELRKLIQRIDREIGKRADQSRKNVLKQVQKLAAAEDVYLAE